jgi:TonB family protein
MIRLEHIARCGAVIIGLATATAWPAAPIEPPVRPQSQQEYWAEFDRKDWDAAVATAERLVAAAREAGNPLALSEALSLLGNAQLGKTDYAAAEAAYAESLGIAEQRSGAGHASTLEPLRGLGYTFAAAGRHQDAVPQLERALLVSHRNFGLFDIGQQGLLRQLALSLTRTGRGYDAEKHMAYLLRVGERTYGADDPRMVSILCLVSDWYADTGNFAPAREGYRAALDIVERKLGEMDVTAVEPLRGLAGTYIQELFFWSLGLRIPRDRFPSSMDGTRDDYKPINPRYLSSDGERALDRALKILESHPQTSNEALADMLIQMGDWYEIKHQPDKALPYYKRAWPLVAPVADDGGKDPRRVHLSFPVRMYYPTPLTASRNLQLPADQVEETYVEVGFTVTADGSVKDAKIIDRNGSQRQAAETLQAIRAARFRPKFANAEPVETTGMTYREVFKVRKQTDDLE